MINYLVDFEENLVPDNCTIIEALKKLNARSVKVIFVVDAEKRIIASVTDGDIRRAILKGISVECGVSEIANKNPYIIREENKKIIENMLVEKRLGAIPLVDNDGRVIKIYCGGHQGDKDREKIDVPIVIMAGGQGKRLYPYTKILPKPLIPIEDTPICERIINSFIDIGCKDFYMIVNYKKNMIKSYLADASIDANISFVDEEIPLGTGGGLKLCKGMVDKTFLLTNCDILILDDVREIIKHHREQKNVVTMVCSLKNFEIPYGVVHFSEGGEISSFEEKPKMSFFTNTGYYILEPEVMNYINDNECIGMPDIIERMKADGKKIGVFPIDEDTWLDMGQFDSMEGMERKLRELASL